VRLQALTGLVSQVTQGAAAVGIILVVHEHAGSLTLAGVVVGALSIAAGVSRPVQGRLIDTRGAAGVLAVCGIVHPVALIAIAGLATVRGLGWLLIALGALAGLALPPVSTSMRAEWGALVGADERTAAYSLVYLVQELSILIGPLILAGVIAPASASVALITVALVAGVGTLGFAASVHADRTRATSLGGARLQRRDSSAIRAGGIGVVLLVSLLVGAVIGGLEVAAPIFATAHGSPAASGLLIAALSVGGIIGATVYGSRHWRAAARLRLLVLLAAMTVWLAVLIAAGGLLVAGVLLLLAGTTLNPALTTLSLIVDTHVPARTAAEAFGWLSTSIAGGGGAASAIAAALSQHRDPRAAFIVAAAAAAGATAIAGLARRRL